MSQAIHSSQRVFGPSQTILAAAYRLLVDQGFGAMSMRGLGALAGMQAGSLYHHFSGKQDVLEEVLHHLLQQRLDSWLVHKPATAHVLLGLEAFVSFHVEYVLERPEEQSLLRSERRYLQDDAKQRLDRLECRYRQELRDLIAVGTRKGLFRAADVEMTTNALFALLEGVDAIVGTRSSKAQSEMRDWMIALSRRLLQVEVDD
ncbi:TetR/AcrR family transcriptional regulator [Pseudomonas sp. CR3202]|uniref:TetR/AcrR family transcriptional regulator n=1 Tax=Pseudomonas sp. CR3202 TaxID=3351532 RepID=UPI003BF069DE